MCFSYFFFLFEVQFLILPGVDSSLKTVWSCSKATDGQRQTWLESRSLSQLLQRVRYAGMPCHSQLQQRLIRLPRLEHEAQVACKDVRRDGAPVSRPRVHPPSPPFKVALLSPFFSLLLLLNLSINLIPFQFHLSTLKPSNQHPGCCSLYSSGSQTFYSK